MKRRLTLFLCILGLVVPLSYASAGTVLSTHTYAWSNNVGYINFAEVIVEDSALAGSAWSANKGFIKFNPSQGGVLNDGTGNLSGSAWGEQLGWIDFNNVSIDANGAFSGTAEGSLVGTITFDCPSYCDVETDWRPTAIPTASPIETPTTAIVTVVNQESAITPSIPGETPISEGLPETGPGTSETERPALFDVISEPVQSTQRTSTPLIAGSIVVGMLLGGALLVGVNKIRAQAVARAKIPAQMTNEKNTQNEIIT